MADGTPIPGTDLVECWRDGKKLYPIYAGPETDPESRFKAATDQAARIGEAGVVVNGWEILRAIDGQWYVNILPSGRKLDTGRGHD